MKSKWKTIAVVVFFILFGSMPVLVMLMLSQKEMSQYNSNDIYQFKEAAYGAPCMVMRQDIQQYYKVSGIVTSDTYRYMNIENNLDKEIRTSVSVGDEIAKDEIIGYVGDKEIVSLYNGIVEEISTYGNAYIKVRSLEERTLTCMVDIDKSAKLKASNDLQLEDGRKVTVKSVSNIAEGNQVKVVFAIENIEYLYGQSIEELKIYTGKVYEDVLVLDASCVYQKSETSSHFVRILDDYGYFVEEIEVQIGFENDDVVSVLNMDEGTICDSGYKSLLSYNGD